MPILGMHFAGCEIKNDTEVDMYIVRSVDWNTFAKTVGVIGGAIAVVSLVGGAAAAAAGAAAAAEGAAAAAAEGAAAAVAGAAGDAADVIITGAAAAAAAAAKGAVTAGLMSAGSTWTIVGVTGGSLGVVSGLLSFSSDQKKQLDHDFKIAADGTDVIVHTDKSIMDIVEENSDKSLAEAMNMTENQVRRIKKVIKDHKYGAKRIAPGKSFKFDTGCFSTWKAHVITENLEEGVADVWTSFWYGNYSQYKASTLWKNISAKKFEIAIHKDKKAA